MVFLFDFVQISMTRIPIGAVYCWDFQLEDKGDIIDCMVAMVFLTRCCAHLSQRDIMNSKRNRFHYGDDTISKCIRQRYFFMHRSSKTDFLLEPMEMNKTPDPLTIHTFASRSWHRSATQSTHTHTHKLAKRYLNRVSSTVHADLVWWLQKYHTQHRIDFNKHHKSFEIHTDNSFMRTLHYFK